MASTFLSTAFILLSIAITQCHALPATTTSTGSFPTMTDSENAGAFQGSNSAHSDSSAAGADGADSGLKMSTGAIIGVSIAIAVICVAFIILWALWFTAKRRNWAVRDTLKYASRRLTGRGAVPPTPKTPHTPHPARAGGQRAGAKYTAGHGGSNTGRQWPTRKGGAVKPHAGWLEEEKELSRSATPSSRGRR